MRRIEEQIDSAVDIVLLARQAVILLRESDPFTFHTTDCKDWDKCSCGFSKWLRRYDDFMDRQE